MRRDPIPRVSKATTQTAPIKGLNALDSIASMPPGFAIVLRNMFAQSYGCQVRKGYRKHVVEGISGNVESLMSHNKTTPSLYAVSRDGLTPHLYDVTAPNSTAIELTATITNARWQHVNFANAAGNHLVAVNGADNMLWFNQAGVLTQVSSADITGIDPKNFIHVYSHQKRLWFVEKNSTRGWYLPVEQITGAATSFNFGALFTRGGILNQIITWTVDSGEGMDDLLVAISDQGEVVVYRGTDPASIIGGWALEGVYFAGAPIGNRSAIRFGGDVLIMTEYGIVVLSDLMRGSSINASQENQHLKYVQHLISIAFSMHRDEFGWQLFLFPAANMAMVNSPTTETSSFQLVMNTITKAWSEFIGYNAYCWELHRQLPFFGSFGAVYRAWEGYTDNETLENDGDVIAGEDIRAEAQTAFDYFGALGIQKRFTMVRPTILSRGAFSLSLSVNTDFVFDSPAAPAAFSFFEPGVWDEDLWNQTIWEGGLITGKSWQSVKGIGTAGALRLLIRARQETYWASTDWLMEEGGIL